MLRRGGNCAEGGGREGREVEGCGGTRRRQGNVLYVTKGAVIRKRVGHEWWLVRGAPLYPLGHPPNTPGLTATISGLGHTH